MGRIFETRKATMFARWNKMAKAFTRVSKDIVMAVKAAGPDPATNSTLHEVLDVGGLASRAAPVSTSSKRRGRQGGSDFKHVEDVGAATGASAPRER